MQGYQPFANQGGLPPNSDPSILGNGGLSYHAISSTPAPTQGPMPTYAYPLPSQTFPNQNLPSQYSAHSIPSQYDPTPTPSSHFSGQTQSTQYLSQAQNSDFSDQYAPYSVQYTNGYSTLPPLSRGGSAHYSGAGSTPGATHGSALMTNQSTQSALTHTVMESYTEQRTAQSQAQSCHNSEPGTAFSESSANHVEMRDDGADSMHANGLKIDAVKESGTPEGPCLPLAPARPNLSENLQATCPMITAFFPGRPAKRLPLRITSLQLDVRCHVATAFVDVKLTCEYRDEWRPLPLQFFMPKMHNTTITNLKIENLVRPKVFATVVVPADEVRKYGWHARQVSWDYDKYAPSSNDPELFVLDLSKGFRGQRGDIYEVTLTYFHPLVFDNGSYYLHLPCTLPDSATNHDQTINDIVGIHVTLNSGLPVDIDFKLDSHPYTVLDSEPGHMELRGNSDVLWTNTDFLLAYKMWGRVIVGACCYVPPLNMEEGTIDTTVSEGTAVITNSSFGYDTIPTDKDKPKAASGGITKRSVHMGQPVMDTRGTFCLTVAPPSPEFSPTHARSCVFILDRSGSMTGDPMEYAIRAVCKGLKMLNPKDWFTVVAFDHEQLWWKETLCEATLDNVEDCIQWVGENVTANGLTDIWAPLGTALNLLSSSAKGLPFIFLITDGCVDNEREICVHVKDLIGQGESQGVSKPRVCTFGIGPFCNHYFLKQLATTARGNFDVAFRHNSIEVQMERMLGAAAHPVLSDLTIQIKGLESCELYPYPIPDLFCGQPLLVSGKFSKYWPRSITLQGKLPGGKTWSQSIESSRAHNIPLDKVFTKSYLDYMTASQWLNGQEEMLQRIVDLSVASGVPCFHTQTVGAEMTPAQAEAMQEDIRSGRRVNIVKYSLAGVAGVGVVGGVAAALVFGDLGATLSNVPIGEMFSSLGDLMSADCCDCCGACCEICSSCLVC